MYVGNMTEITNSKTVSEVLRAYCGSQGQILLHIPRKIRHLLKIEKGHLLQVSITNLGVHGPTETRGRKILKDIEEFKKD
jgi:hypothetical protein